MKKHPASLFIGTASLFATAVVSFAGTGKSGKTESAPPREDIVVHPVTSPYFHEDSFITTDLRPVFAYHTFPGAVLGGGYATITALQLRIKITDSLQFVAYKDGWLDFNTPGTGNQGWNDIAAGVKWAFYRNEAAQFQSAIGLGYEFASGDDSVLQDDDSLRTWLSVNKGFGNLHLGATFNYSWSLGNGSSTLGNSDWLSWHFHADYQVARFFSPFVEVNGYHTTSNGSPLTPFSGADVLDLGGNSGQDTISVGFGAEVRPLKWFALRAAYEIPIGDRTDVYGHRWTFSSVIKF